MVREVIITMNNVELDEVRTMYQNAGLAAALEMYSREAERQKEPVLV